MTSRDCHVHDVVNDVAVVCCTEAGRLERQSLLLCETLRLRGGRYASVPVYSFQPRPGPALAARTRRRFAELGVMHIEANLNQCLPAFGFANKPHAAAFVESHLSHEIIVVLDSDMLVLSEPTEFSLATGDRIAVAPEPFKVAGTTDEDDNAAMWDAIETHVGLGGPRRYVTTLVDQVRIRAYYNSGLVIARRDLGVMRLWHDLMQSIAATVAPQDSRAVFAEQIALTMAMAKLDVEPRVLPNSYNYQIAWHDELPDDIRVPTLDGMVIAHYHRLFDQPGRRPLARLGKLTPGDRDEEIDDLIRSTGVTPDPLRSPLRAARVAGRKRAVGFAKKLGFQRNYGKLLGRS